jgi:hypothetical protein
VSALPAADVGHVFGQTWSMRTLDRQWMPVSDFFGENPKEIGQTRVVIVLTVADCSLY